MADGYNLGQAGTMSAEEFAQQQQLNRQQQMAALLMQQGQKQAQGQMIGNRYVAPSFFQNILPLVQTAVGTYLGGKADTEAAKLAQAIRENKGDVEQQIINKMTPQAGRAEEVAGPAYRGVAPSIQYPEQAADYAGALKMIQMNPYGAGKEYVPSILKQMNPEPTTLEKEYKAVKAQGYAGSLNDFKNQMSEYQKIEAANAKARLGLEGARFGLEQQKFAQEMSGGKLTETQGNATAFGMRMKESNQLLNDLEKKGVKDTGVIRSTIGGIVGMTPFVGEKMQQGVQASMNVLPSALGGPSSEQQQVDAARKNFVTAVLRKESGAAISPTEFYTESQKYFPQPGDSNETIAQKRHARETAIKAMEIQAGPGKRQIEEFNAAPKKVVNFNDLP
jgi:hypothetical protein